MLLIHTIEDVRAQIKSWKKDGLTVGLVPTMGALHAGHMSLINKCTERCDKTVVSIFVNPIQFGPSEDFDQYPRTLEADAKLCKKAGVDIIFAPTPKEMYGEGHILSNDFLTYVVPPFFYSNKLCGKTRVGHFDGVCTVVNKLFNIVQPNFAFFVDKDRQQLIILKKMVKDLNIPVTIVPCPIVRDENGLALSSRNKYLSQKSKKDALVLNKILFNIKSCYDNGITDVRALTETAYSIMNFQSQSLEYLEFRDQDTLEEKLTADDNTIVFIAVKVGGVRLIDNIALGMIG